MTTNAGSRPNSGNVRHRMPLPRYSCCFERRSSRHRRDKCDVQGLSAFRCRTNDNLWRVRDAREPKIVVCCRLECVHGQGDRTRSIARRARANAVIS